MLNHNCEYGCEFDEKNIHCYDNGDYQGTLIFVFSLKTYQPGEYEHIVTFANYGSCSGCDTLLRIFDDDEGDKEAIVNDLKSVVLHILENCKAPFNSAYRAKFLDEV